MKSLLLLLALTGPALADPLRPISECLDPARARSWHHIDSDEILVDAGRKRFHLQLEPTCPELAFAINVGFVSGDGIGRICGSPNDRVIMRRRSPIDIPCRIAVVTPLTKEQYAERMHGLDKPKGVVEIREQAAENQAQE